MFASRITFNGKDLSDEDALPDSLKPEAVERSGGELCDLIASVVCPVHGKTAEGAHVDFDDNRATVTVDLHGLCCEELRTAIESELEG
jgi:hypothetical protein